MKRFLRPSTYLPHGTMRKIKEITFDNVDIIYRCFTKNRYLPPLSLRQYAGGSKTFIENGNILLNSFLSLGLIKPGYSILDVGCGSGRVALLMEKDNSLQKSIRYIGMDLDLKSVQWCRRNIEKRHNNFSFYHVDMFSKTYNPTGKVHASNFVFPHSDNEFDFVFLTSVFTHLLPKDTENYLQELHRILKPGGAIYATFFTYNTKSEAIDGMARCPFKFKYFHENYALESELFPEDAVAYQKDFIFSLAKSKKLELKDFQEGGQDVLIFLKKI